MDRRELLKMIAAVTGGAVIGGEFLLSGCKNEPAMGGAAFTAEDTAFLDEVADTILPTTSSPGAKTAKVGTYMTVVGKMVSATSSKKAVSSAVNAAPPIAGSFLQPLSSPVAKTAKVGTYMTVMVNDCYDAEDQKVFHEGIGKLNDASKKANGKSFMESTPEQRTTFLTQLDKEAKEYQKSKKKEDRAHYFTMMKQLTLSGYFTSKEGATMALRYVAVPGKYEGCIDYKKGDKAWAT